jgi:hypothetical protein
VEEYLQPISGIPLNEFPIRPKPPVKKPEESRSRRLRMRKREKLEELRKRLRKCGNEFRRALKHKWASDAVLLDREINKIEDKIQKEEEEEDKEEVQVIKESIEIKIVRKIELDPRAKRASELERLERRCKKHPYFKSYYEGLEKKKPSVSEKSEPEVVVID